MIHTLSSSISTVLLSVFNFLFVSILTKQFGIETYSIYAQWITIFSLILVFTSFGAPAALQSRLKGTDRTRSVDETYFNQTLHLSLVLTIMSIPILYYYFQKLILVDKFFLACLISFFILCKTFNNLSHYTQRSIRKFYFPTFSVLVEPIAKLIGIFVLLEMSYETIDGILTVATLATLALTLINSINLRTFLKFRIFKNFITTIRNTYKYFLLSVIEAVISYWLPLLGIIFLAVQDFGILHLTISIGSVGLTIPNTIYNQFAPDIRDALYRQTKNYFVRILVKLYSTVLSIYCLVSAAVVLVMQFYSIELFGVDYHTLDRELMMVIAANLCVVMYSPLQISYRIAGRPLVVMRLKLYGIMISAVLILFYSIWNTVGSTEIVNLYLVAQLTILTLTFLHFLRGKDAIHNHHYD